MYRANSFNPDYWQSLISDFQYTIIRISVFIGFRMPQNLLIARMLRDARQLKPDTRFIDMVQLLPVNVY